MNPEPQILPLPPEPTEAPQPNDVTHRGKGKIARLPKALRDQVNNWLLDGLSYPKIIAHLGEQGKELKPGHLHEYKKRGHQHWLRQREWFEHVTASSEFATDLLAAPDTTALHEAGLRMAAAQMLDQLMRFNATADAENAQPDPEQFARLVNALSRLTREALAFRKYHDAIAKAQAAEPKYLDPGQKPSQKAQDILLTGWRNFFGHDLTQPMPDVGRQTSASAGSEASSPPLPSFHTPAAAVATPAQPFGDTTPPSVPPLIATTTDHSSPPPLSSPSSPSSLSSHPLALDPILPTDPTTETHGNLQQPNSPPESAAHEIQNSQAEHCLECHAPLPALRPDNRRPSPRCENCGRQLPPPGTCVEPSIEQCPDCRANLPRLLTSLERPSSHCHQCGTSLPSPKPADPSPPTPNAADPAIASSTT